MNCLQTTTNWFVSIPDVVWAAIGGSALTLFGVFLQLVHDGKQRNRERELNLRRDVYLPAAEEFAATVSYIVRLPNIDLDEQGKMEPVPGFMKIAAKINIVGSNETIVATNTLVSKIDSVFVPLMSKKLPLAKLKSEIKVLEKIVDDCQTRAQKAIFDMRSLTFNKESDQSILQLVKSDFERAQKDSEKFGNELSIKRDQHIKMTCDMSVECLEATMQIQRFFVPLLIAIRKELKLPFDPKKCLKPLEQINREAREPLDKFIRDITKDIDAKKS